MMDELAFIMRYVAITDILKIFAETEIGTTAEIDNAAICQYLRSPQAISDYWEAKTPEDCYDVFTKQVEEGYPIWQLLKLPEFTRQQLEKEFQAEREREEAKRKKKYKCLTCKYLDITKTGFGDIYGCKNPCELKQARTEFSLKTRCKNYEQ